MYYKIHASCDFILHLPCSLLMFQAWEDLALPAHATYEDLVSVSGKPLEIQKRSTGKAEINEITVQSEAVSFLSTWKPKLEKEPSMETILEVSTPPKHIHHFCTVTNEYQLPEQFKHLGRKYHTPEQFLAPKQPFRVSIDCYNSNS